MRTAAKSVMIGLFSLLLMSGFSQAQNNGGNHDRSRLRHKLREILTDEQLSVFQANRKEMKELHDAFLATFSEEQLAILNNDELTREEKRAALKETFTAEQLAMIENNQSIAKENRTFFQSLLSEDQLEKLKRLFRWRRR